MSELDRYQEMAAAIEQVRIIVSGYSASIYRQSSGKWWSTIADPNVEYDSLPDAFDDSKKLLAAKAAKLEEEL